MPEERPGDRPEDGEWLTVAAAARRLRVSPRAVRGRIDRGTIPTKPNGNLGRLVLVRPGDAIEDHPEDGPGDELELLRAMVGGLEGAIGDLRTELARVRARLGAAEDVARAGLEARDELLAELRRGLEREQARADRLEAEARRPWWRRLPAKLGMSACSVQFRQPLSAGHGAIRHGQNAQLRGHWARTGG